MEPSLKPGKQSISIEYLIDRGALLVVLWFLYQGAMTIGASWVESQNKETEVQRELVQAVIQQMSVYEQEEKLDEKQWRDYIAKMDTRNAQIAQRIEQESREDEILQRILEKLAGQDVVIPE